MILVDMYLVDEKRKSFLEDCSEYWYNYYGVGAFVTLTYDDIEVPMGKNGELTLRYKDVQDYMKRIRNTLFKKYGYRHEFKYICVGEYGGENGRPHYHILFFGLDYMKHEQIMWKCWDKGIVDVGSIRQGGIGYVLKYMEKQQQRRKLYNDIDMEEPFLKHSVGIANGLIKSKEEEIYRNHGKYKSKGNVMRGIPRYYKNKMQIQTITDYSDVRKEMSDMYKICPKESEKHIKTDDVKKYLYEKAIATEQKLININRQQGIAQFDLDTETTNNLMNEQF